MSNKYAESKIYAIRSKQTEKCYIGSTIKSLNTRMTAHRAYNRDKWNGMTSKQIVQYDDAYIELIENYPCESQRELFKREGEIIQNTPGAVNRNTPGKNLGDKRLERIAKLEESAKSTKEWFIEFERKLDAKRMEKKASPETPISNV